MKWGGILAEFFKHEIAKWNVATDDLTLEQEAAYHRVVATIRLYERPFRHNLRVLSGLWRCNERRAKRLLEELVFAGKLTIEDGFIIDEKAVDDASTLRQSRVDKASAGRLGGIESGKARRKPLENNDTDEAHALTREEKTREEKKEEKREPIGSPKKPSRKCRLPDGWVPSDRNISDAQSHNFSFEEISNEAVRFRDHHAAKGTTFADWDAGWRTWIGNARKFAAGSRLAIGAASGRNGQGGSIASIVARRRAAGEV